MSLLELELKRKNVGRILAAIILVAVIAALYLSPARDLMTLDQLRSGLERIRSIWYGPVLFIAVYATACIFAVPASPFVAAAGIIWGWFFGGLYSHIGSMIGATASYYVARYIGGGMLARLGSRGRQIEQQLETAGYKPMMFLRLIGLPFPVLNFAGGVARMPFGAYFGGTFLGILPSQFVIAYSADAIAGGTLSKGDALVRVFIAAGLMAMLVLIPTWLKKKYYRP